MPTAMKTVLLPLTARATLPARLLQAAAAAMAPATADASATATTTSTPRIAFRIARARDATVAEQLVVSRLRQTHAQLFADDSDFVVDFGSRDDLHEALDGCDGLVVATAADAVETVETTLVEAARAVGGVKDVLKVSCPQGFLGEKSAVALGVQHWHVEQRIRQLQFEGNVRFVRPATLMDTLLQGKRYEMICGRSLSVSVKRGRVAFVHPVDVAEVMHSLLVNKISDTSGPSEPEQYAVTGPEALTFQEVADLLSAGIGQRVTYSYLPLWAVQPSMWIRGERPEAIASEIQTARAIEEGAEADVVSTVEDLLGRKPRTLREFIKEHEDAWPLRAYK